jgi:uncharacterized protein (TIGR03085 family)
VRSLALAERAALCDLLDRLGPDEPTLCAGWRTRELAAHLVLRESRLDALPGIVLPIAAPWTARLQARLAAGAFDELVGRLRTGPPRFSPFRPRPIDEAANGVEFFVHHEDVRRAQPGWQPRTLDPSTDDYLWARARRMARTALHRESTGVALARNDTDGTGGTRGADGTGRADGADGTNPATAPDAYLVRRPRPGQPVLIVRGAPSELLLYLFGRRAHACVQITPASIGRPDPTAGDPAAP